MSVETLMRPAAPTLTLTRQPPATHTPWASLLVHGAVLALWAALLAMAILARGPEIWTIGIVYVLYDTGLLLFVASQTKTPAPASRLPDAPLPRLSVVIAARNEAAVLVATIRSVLTNAPTGTQVIVADDGSDDGSADELIKAFDFEAPAIGQSAASPVIPNLFWLRLPHGGKARALNTALPLLTGEVALTLDADTRLQPTALQAIARAFACDAELVAATGVLEPVCTSDAVGTGFELFQRLEYMRNYVSRMAWARLNVLLLVSGAFAAYRTSALRAVGGFEPRSLVEDYELTHRIHRLAYETKQNWRVAVVPTAIAETDAPASLPAFLRQRRRWFAGFLQTQYWNRDMVANRRFGKLGGIMLVVKALDTLQPLYGLTAFGVLMYLVLSGQWMLVGLALAIMLAKIAFDIAFHFFAAARYAALTGRTASSSPLPALMALALEPFSFQLLRHIAALRGWAMFLTGRHRWGRG